MIQWNTPWAFLFFLPLLAVLVWVYWRRDQRTPSLQMSRLQPFKELPKPIRAHLVPIPFLLKVVAIGLAIVALARPQQADVKVKKNVEGIDIMVALDVSDSMLIEDMEPENRLEASKAVIRNFVEKRISDRIGLLVFSGESYTRVPVTLDYPLLLKSLKDVQARDNMKMGTAIGVALANAAGRLAESTAKSRVVIFLTDGENNSGTIDPDTALDIAKGYGVRIYSIGMGRDGQAQLPVYLNGPGGKKIKRYRPIHSKVNEELLGEMARETGGKYFRATTSEDLTEVFREIDQLEKTKIDIDQYTRYSELYPPYLFWAVMLYLSSVVLGRTVLRRGP
jgi:Ca-activated chloride channel family protein